MLITILIVVFAVAAALTVNRLVWRRGQEAGTIPSDGLQLKEVTAPLATLAVLLLAFVLVQSFSSWSGARQAEAAEANATLLLFREADLINNPRLRQEVRKQVICYATSVIEQEWPAMADGKISNVPNYWASTIRRSAIRQVRSGADDAAGSAIITRDGERATAREDRLAEARTAVPPAMYWLMLLAVAVALVLIGVITIKGMSVSVHAAVVVTAAVVFTSTLLLIRDLDQPYDGINARDPAQTAYVRGQMVAEVVGGLPCDSRGLPTDAPLFRPETASRD
jgi:Protein of unknown function (DUF4239)